MAGNLPHALDYLKAGYSVIPITAGSKIPPTGFGWKKYQEQQATENEVMSWPNGNLAVITGKISGITVVDFDSQEALDYFLSKFQGRTPCVDTPRGMHAWFKYEEGVRNSVKINGLDIDVRGDGGYVLVPPSINAQGKGYKWLQSPFDVPLAPVPDFLKESIVFNNNSFSSFTRAHEGSITDHNRQHLTTNDNIMFEYGTRDNDLFNTANCLFKGGMAPERIAQVLERLILSWGEAPDDKWIKAKINSAMDRAGRRERNLTAEIRDFVVTTNGIFSTTDVYNGQHLTTREEKKAAVVVLARLAKEGLLEKYGEKNGVYRRIDQTIEYMDFENADPNDTIDLRLPLDIHKKTKLFPKAVIALGGVSGMGKTLFILNAIRENMGRMPCFYFNSEMSPQQLKAKLSYFPTAMHEWVKNMKVIEGWDFNNIADKIQPDALNCIDYLEPEGERPYMIHAVISAIIRKLNRGTALIAIQKKPGAKLATGGIYSIKAASLALALDWGRIEIVKNRNREADRNPTLNTMSFDVKGGYQFSAKGGWYAGSTDNGR